MEINYDRERNSIYCFEDSLPKYDSKISMAVRTENYLCLINEINVNKENNIYEVFFIDLDLGLLISKDFINEIDSNTENLMIEKVQHIKKEIVKAYKENI